MKSELKWLFDMQLKAHANKMKKFDRIGLVAKKLTLAKLSCTIESFGHTKILL